MNVWLFTDRDRHWGLFTREKLSDVEILQNNFMTIFKSAIKNFKIIICTEIITGSEPEGTFWPFKASLSSYECNMYATLKNLNTHEHTKCQNIYHFRLLRQHFFVSLATSPVHLHTSFFIRAQLATKVGDYHWIIVKYFVDEFLWSTVMLVTRIYWLQIGKPSPLARSQPCHQYFSSLSLSPTIILFYFWPILQFW